MNSFFDTVGGQDLVNYTLPKLSENIERLAVAVEKLETSESTIKSNFLEEVQEILEDSYSEQLAKDVVTCIKDNI